MERLPSPAGAGRTRDDARDVGCAVRIERVDVWVVTDGVRDFEATTCEHTARGYLRGHNLDPRYEGQPARVERCVATLSRAEAGRVPTQ